MKRLSLVILIQAASAAYCLGAGTCGSQTLKGVYGALATGSLMAAPLPPVLLGPSARAGHVEVDGNGNVVVKATISFNGAIFQEEYSGTYSVNPDCTVMVTLFVPFPGVPFLVPLTFFGAIADSGRELSILIVDPPGAVIRIGLRRQEKKNCSAHDLFGGYLLDMSGTIVSQPSVPAPGIFARVGRVAFDGKGQFSANTQASYSGIIVPEAFTGTYAVDSACNVSLQYTLGSANTWVGSLTNNSAGADLIVSAPQGAVVVGTLSKQ